MQEVRSAAQEAQEDIFFGQVSLIAARYFLIIGGLALILQTVKDPAQFAISMIPIILFIIVNFFLHARYIMGQPANQNLIFAASALDLLIITGIVIYQKGLPSQFFVFYYPVLAAFGFVFPRRTEVIYTVAACVLYIIACLITTSLSGDTTEAALANVKSMGLRLVAMAAAGGLSNYYFRILRARRRAVAGAAAPDLAAMPMGPAR